MAPWFSLWKMSDGAEARPDAKRRQGSSARSSARRTRSDRRDQPTPLTWSSPDQDFITRYGDQFDG
jgi:hypothetical protein